MPRVISATRHVGSAAQAEVPAALVRKLPLNFKKLGFATHKKFDMLALDAAQMGDAEHALEQLAELMNNCTSCHTTYRLALQAERVK